MKKYLLLILLLLTGCDNYLAKNLGGTSVENLPPNKKLINITWKNDHLWILTRDMYSNEKPESYVFHESANYGLLNGKVIINEHK